MAGCSTSGSETVSTSANTLITDTSQPDTDVAADEKEVGPLQTLKPGVLTVCASPQGSSLSSTNSAGEWVGLEQELLAEIAQRENLTIETVDTTIEKALGLLEKGECDLLAGGINTVNTFDQQVLLSDSYLAADQALLTQTSALGEITSFESLQGLSVGVLTDSPGVNVADTSTKETTIREFADLNSLIESLEKSQIEAAIADRVELTERANKSDGLNIVGLFLSGEGYGFAAKPGNTGLIDGLNQSLATLKSEGVYQPIENKWLS